MKQQITITLSEELVAELHRKRKLLGSGTKLSGFVEDLIVLALKKEAMKNEQSSNL